MPLYTASRTSAALSTSSDSLTVVASPTKPLRVYVIDAKGMGTSSAANEILVSRSTGGSGSGGAITPAKMNSGAPTAGFAVYTSWSVQPTLTETLYRLSPNANGGVDKYIAFPGSEFQVPVSGQISIRAASGSSNVVLCLVIEEVDG